MRWRVSIRRAISFGLDGVEREWLISVLFWVGSGCQSGLVVNQFHDIIGLALVGVLAFDLGADCIIWIDGVNFVEAGSGIIKAGGFLVEV